MVVKTLWPEDDSEAATSLLQAAAARVSAPSLLTYEVADAIRRTDQLASAKERQDALARFVGLPIPLLHPDREDLAASLRLGLERNVTVYDAVYLVTAKRADGKLVTADARFAQRARDPDVVLLADVTA